MSNGNLGSLLPIATFQMTMDNIPAGPLIVENQNVLESMPQGNLSWISGTVLGRHFSGTYSEPTRRLTIRAQVFGTYHWTFRGGLIYKPGAAICGGDDFYLLEGEYGIYRTTIRVIGPNPSGDFEQVGKGTWNAWTCFPSIGP